MSNEWWVEDEASTHIEGDGWGVFDASGNLLCVCPLKITALAIASMSGYAKRLCRCIPGWLDPYCPVLGQHDYGTQRQTPSP